MAWLRCLRNLQAGMEVTVWHGACSHRPVPGRHRQLRAVNSTERMARRVRTAGCALGSGWSPTTEAKRSSRGFANLSGRPIRPISLDKAVHFCVRLGAARPPTPRVPSPASDLARPRQGADGAARADPVPLGTQDAHRTPPAGKAVPRPRSGRQGQGSAQPTQDVSRLVRRLRRHAFHQHPHGFHVARVPVLSLFVHLVRLRADQGL